MATPTVVLDLGSSKAVALAARADEDGIEILSRAETPSRGLKRGVVVDLEETARAADRVLRQIADDLRIEISRVTVAFSGPHVEGTNGQGLKPIVPRGRTITHQDVMEVVNHSRNMMFPPDRELFQALPREFKIDGERGILRPIGMSGGQLEVVTYLISGQSAHLQNLDRAIQLNGRHVNGLVLAPLAAGIAVLTEQEIETGAAVVDIGAGKTDLAIFSSGSLVYSATIPVGSALVSSDLSKLLKTSPEEAERLKVEYANAVPKDVDPGETIEVRQLGQPLPRPMQRVVLCEIVESRMREIATMVAQQIERSGFAPLLPGGVAITGGGSKMKGVDRLFGDVLKHARVRVAAPDVGSRTPMPELATAVGLAQFTLQNQEELSPVRRDGRGIFDVLHVILGKFVKPA